MKKNLAPLALSMCLPLLCSGARAEAPEFFAAKPYSWREDEKDRRFSKTRLAKALSQPPSSAACARVAASYLMALAESAPYFHKKDERLVLFTGMVAPLEGPQFPAGDFLVHLLHRVAIDGKAPEAFLSTARQLKERYKAPIDLARLAFAVDGLQPVDSVELTLGALLSRYEAEVLLAPTLARPSAIERFEDKYLDRDVVWGDLLLSDVRSAAAPQPKKGAKTAGDAPALVHSATFLVPLVTPNENPLFPSPKREPIRISARLAPDQYIDLKAVVRSEKYLVHGRLWRLQPGGGKPGMPTFDIELRDALLFDSHDWSNYGGFASAADAAACDACRNDLSPLGMKEQQGVGQRDGFSHP